MAPAVTLPALLRQATATDADRVAMQVHRAAALTYGDWDRRSDAQAHGLLHAGVRRGDRVVLLFDASQWTEYAVTYLAVLRAAGVAVPLRADLGAIRLQRVLDDCRPAAVVAGAGAARPSLPTLDPLGLEQVEQAEADRAPAVGPSDAAELLYVDGTLSPAHAITRSHADLLAGPSLSLAGAGGDHSLLHCFAVGTVAGQDALCACLRPPLVRSLVLPAFDPEEICGLLASGAATTCALHPATAQALVASGAAARHDLARVSGLVLSGGPIGSAALMRTAAAFPHAGMLLVDVVGRPPATRTAFTYDRSRPGSVGAPADGTVVSIADDAGRPLERGEVGELCVGCPPATRRSGTPRSAPDAAEPAGCLGYLDGDGYLYVVESRLAAVRVGAASVSCAELECVLREHPAVADAALLGAPSDGTASELRAAVVARAPLSATELRAHLRRRLGDRKAVGRIDVVDELPRNGAGILLSRELRRRLQIAVDDADRGDVPSATIETVTSIYERLLRRSDIAPEADFFELGGDWPAAARLIALIEDAFDVRLAPATLRDASTVAGVARAVDRLRAAREPAERTPVAFSQEGMLWQECFAPGSQNLPGLARRYRGRLDSAAVGRALDEIVRRHEPLRSTFAISGGRPLQVVHAHRPLELPIRDLSALGEVERDATVARLVAEAGRRPFDLVTGPLFAPALLRLDDDDHVLVIRAHHAVFDDWSVGVFRREFAALYAAYAAGDPSPLAAPRRRFTDFARSQRRRLAGPAGTRQMSFWRRELEGAPFVTQLAVDDPERPEGSRQAAGEPVTLTLPAQLGEALRTLARRERTTLYMTMLAAFGVLVGRYTAQRDLLMATVVANRNASELEDLIGCFTKKLPLRLRLTGDPTFRELLARTRAALLGALSHQDLPFEAIVQDALGGAASSHGVVPQAAVMFQGVTPPQPLALPGLQTAGLQTSASATRAHFSAADDGRAGDGPTLPWGSGLYQGTFVIVSLIESADELSCVARGAFHAPAVRALLASFATLLADVVSDPARRISQLAIIDAQAQEQQLELGRGAAQPPPAATIPRAFLEQVRRAPDRIAVDDGDGSVSYAQLDARCERLADLLRAHGIGPGGRVGIALEASPEAVAAVLAVSKLGAAWVALDPLDEPDRLAWIVRSASLDVVVVRDGAPHAFADGAVVTVDAGGPRPAGDSARTTPLPDVGADDDATIFYGAGPSAVAHGVVLDHRCVLNLLTGMRAVHRPPTAGEPARSVLLSEPWQDGFLRQLAALLDGHRLHVAGPRWQSDPHAAVALVAAGRVDVVDCSPDELEALLDAGLSEALVQRAPRHVEPVLVVGARAAVGPDLWPTLCGLQAVRAHLLYGPPECGFGATARATGRPCPARGAGRPLANVGCHVLDAAGRPVPTRAVGELHLAGPGLARCYVAAPEATRAKFVTRASAGAGAPARMHRTGLLARCLPDGGVELLGPLSADGDLRGLRIDTSRIAAALRRCGAVRDANVALEADEHGQGRLVADVVPAGQPPTAGRLRAVLWSTLPGYAWPSFRSGVDERGDAEIVLRELWAELRGLDRPSCDETYWQAFSFLRALDRAHDCGVAVPSHDVTANRTLAALEAALAAGCVVHRAE